MHPTSLPDADTERAAMALTLRFFQGLDTRDDTAALSCFHADGTWERQGAPLQGHAAIGAALAARAADRRTAHVLSNLRVERVADDRVEVHFLLVAYEGTVQAGAAAPPARIAGIRQCRDALRHTQEGWKIHHKSSTGLFGPASA